MTNEEDENIKSEFIKKLICNFLDIIMIAHFQQKAFSGYDVIQFVNRRFGILLSSGTVYYTLYAMEREKLLESYCVFNKRVFKATEKGSHRTQLLMDPKEMGTFFANIMKK